MNSPITPATLLDSDVFGIHNMICASNTVVAVFYCYSVKYDFASGLIETLKFHLHFDIEKKKVVLSKFI